MADAKKVTKRELVKELIEQGDMTKAEIAAELDMTAGSVSSQMTYLRWMGLFIKYNEDKVLSFVTEEEYDAWQEDIKTNRKTKAVSTKTPEEQAATIAKTLGNQRKSLAKWEEKLLEAEELVNDDPDDEDNIDYRDECDANIVLLKIKIKRNEAKAADLPEVEETVEETVEEELL